MSPWLNTSDVAEYLRYTGEKPLRSVYRFMERHSIVARKEECGWYTWPIC